MKDAQSFVKPKAGQGAPVEGEVIVMTGEKPRRPTPKQVKAAKLYSENLGSVKPKPTGEILREAGYSQQTSESPAIVVESDTFQALLETMLPDDLLSRTHKKLLTHKKIEHMVFPVYNDPEAMIPEEGDLPDEYLEAQGHGGALKRTKKVVEGATLSDDDITEMLLEVNCTVRKIVHGETARHVYYWADDAKSQLTALELAYRLKGHLAKDNGTGGINFNLFQGGQTFVTKGEE